MKRKLCTFLLTGVVVMGATGCGLLPKEEELPTAPVLVETETEEYTVASVVRGDVRVTETIRTNYVASESEKMSFKTGGEIVSEVYVQVGDEVKKGDVLMELDISAQQDQLRQQQDRLDDLYLQLEHLYESQDLDLSQAELQNEKAAANGTTDWTSQVDTILEDYADQAQSIKNSIMLAEMRLGELQKAIEDRQIIASFDGLITDMYDFQDGERAVKGKNVITLSNMSAALFEVYSENGDLLKSGETYILECGDKEYEVMAHLAEELDLANVKEGHVYLSLVIPDPSLEQGASGTVHLTVEESLGTLWVPADAVREMRDKHIVYCLDEKGFREMKEVKIGIDNGKIVEIVSGLEENEMVILD